MSLLLWLRTLLLGNDRDKAQARERQALAEEFARRGELVNRLAHAFSAGGPDAVDLGNMVGSERRVRLPARMLATHTGIWGPTGSGKTYMCVLMLSSLLRAGLRRMIICDPKGELVHLFSRAIIDVARTLPEKEAEDLLSRVIILNLFSATEKAALPRLQLLALEQGGDAELIAFATGRLITDESDMGVGIRQESVLYRSIECLVRAKLPLTVLPEVIQEPLILDALAEQCAPSELFRATAARLRSESKDRLAGILSRCERLLRLRSTRLALGGAPDALDFAELLADKIVLISLEPPEGSVDVGRFLSGLLWVRLTQAARRRPNGAAPSILVLEEAPAFLAAGNSRSAEAAEDALRLYRAKGVSLYLLAQQLADMGKISSTLPSVIRTNVQLHVIFRTLDDWSAFLPVTGRRLGSSAPPWQERRVQYLDRGAESSLLREELARLPDRTAYLLERRTGLPAALIRTADLTIRATEEEVQALEARSLNSGAVLSVPDLEKGMAAVEERIRALLGRRPPPSRAPAQDKPSPRRRRQPLEMG